MRKISVGRLKIFRKEFELLKQERVISDGVYDSINEYYESNTKSSIHWVLIAFAILGAMSIAGGIILILAHNWAALGRPLRTVMSALPVIIGFAWSYIALKKNSIAWRESAGIFYSIAVGASIALIGQTYHLPSNTVAFFMTWLLLILPIMFILNSTASYMVYLALLCSWTFTSLDDTGTAYMFWALFVPVLAKVIYLYKSDKDSPSTLVCWYGVIAVLLICIGGLFEDAIPELWLIAYAFLLSLFGLVGSKLYKDSEGLSNPLRLVGFVGIVFLTYLFTLDDFWDDVGLLSYRYGLNSPVWDIWYDVSILFAIVLGWAIAVAKNFKKHSCFDLIILTIFPLCVTFVYLFGDDLIASIIFNVIFAFFGIIYIVFGAREHKLGQLNWGMIILSVLLFTRFLDSDFSFLARGIVFIVFGSCFLTANVLLLKLKKRENY